MNKKGMAWWMVLLLVLAVAYFLNVAIVKDSLDNLLKGGAPITPTPKTTTSKCPSSGLTSVTINTQEALATTATNSVHDYYIYNGDELVSNANSGADGKSTFDVECAPGKTYKGFVINETTNSGFYGQEITIDATDAVDVHNLKTYEYGELKVDGLGNAIENPGDTTFSNITGGANMLCGFKIQFHVNESVSGYNKPLIMCEGNTTSITDVTISALEEANTKAPSRLSATSGTQFFVWEVPTLVTSQDSMKTYNGQIQFSSTGPGENEATFKCRLVDQADWKKAEYQSISFANGWVFGAQNDETVADIAAPDTATSTIRFSPTGGNGYC